MNLQPTGPDEHDYDRGRANDFTNALNHGNANISMHTGMKYCQ